MEADVRPGQICQATQAACFVKPSTTMSPQPASGITLPKTICVTGALLLLLGLLIGMAVARFRGRDHESRERLLRESGPAVPLVEVSPTGMRVAVVITCGKFTGGNPSLENLDGAHEQGLRVDKLFRDGLGFDFVQHVKDVPTTAAFWEEVGGVLRQLNGKERVLLVLYFITHGVDVDSNLHMAMSAAAPLALLDEYYLTKASLQRGFQTIERASDAKSLYNCQPLPYLNVVIFTDTCRKQPPQGATMGQPRQAAARHLQMRDKPARIGFVHACDRDRPATGDFTEVFLEMAGEPCSLDALIDSMRIKLEATTGAGRQQRICCDVGSLVLKDIFLHPASGLPSSSSSTILAPTCSESGQTSGTLA